MIFIGDIALNGIFCSDSKNNFARFQKVEELFTLTNLVFANLEMPIWAPKEKNEYKKIIHYSSYDVTKYVLQNLNISCVSLANNHIYDCKLAGLQSTINLLDKLNVAHTGAGWKASHIEPVVLNNKDKSIGFIAYVDKLTNPKTESFPELFINYLDLTTIKRDIIKIKGKVDFLICSLHWGDDYSNFYTKDQQRIAREIIDSGADIIIGHHPHTIQPYEIYKGKYIFYSLGQICFGDFIWEGELRALRRKTKKGMIVKMENFGNIEIIPTIERKDNYIEIYKSNIMRKLTILSRINELMFKYVFIRKTIKIKENIFDRFFEYFFGYYRKPIKQLFAFKNFSKINYLFRNKKSQL